MPIPQEHRHFARLGVAVADAPKVARVAFGGVVPVELDGLVADQSGAAIYLRRVQASRIEVSLGARDEEATGLVH